MRRDWGGIGVWTGALTAVAVALGFAHLFLNTDSDSVIVDPSSRGPQSSERSLNPHNYREARRCESIDLDNPEEEARQNIAKGDLRPFTIFGFGKADVPGIFCASGNYNLEARGGTYTSDIPDACGGDVSYSHAPPKKMEAYNRALGADKKFQQISGCRPSTYCEERYGKGWSGATERDPRCPANHEILLRVAERGTSDKLAEVLADFDARIPHSRDAITQAYLGAIAQAEWSNVEMLLKAGADINGRARSPETAKRRWLGAPLPQAFNRNENADKILERVSSLLRRGANFDNPGNHMALSSAAASNDPEAVRFLLDKGASPNGAMTREDLDRSAKGSIASAGSGFPQTPFYTAIRQARQRWSRDTLSDIDHAEREKRKGRENAVALWQAGGRFLVGSGYDALREDPDIAVASIYFAAAHREGRLQDLAERLLYPNGTEKRANPANATPEQLRFITYVQAVRACRFISLRPQRDRVKLCAYGDV